MAVHASKACMYAVGELFLVDGEVDLSTGALQPEAGATMAFKAFAAVLCRNGQYNHMGNRADAHDGNKARRKCPP